MKVFRKLFLLTVLFVTALQLTACQHYGLGPRTDITQYECPRDKAIDRESGAFFDPGSKDRPSTVPIVKVVEFTNEGEVHDRCQWSDVLYEVRGTKDRENDVRGAKDNETSTKRSKFVVIYVHGWKHNASKDDTDLDHFQQWIKRLSESRSENEDVVGIYVSWPGQSIDIPIINNLTFWGRKGSADRVSAAANFSKLLSSIVSISRARNNPNDFIVGIGHSFGARILFSGVSPLLLHEVQTHHPGIRLGTYGAFKGILDLTVLLNPAFEATRYTAFDSIRRWQENVHSRQQPILLSISTNNDYATQYAFPIGQVIGTRWHERERTTLGNYNNYTTHRLQMVDSSKTANEQQNFWFDHFCNPRICLSRSEDKRQPGNPFLVAATDASIIDGHNGVWDDLFLDWLAEFIRKVKAQSQSSDPTIATNASPSQSCRLGNRSYEPESRYCEHTGRGELYRYLTCKEGKWVQFSANMQPDDPRCRASDIPLQPPNWNHPAVKH
jgi:hypothetical protein